MDKIIKQFLSQVSQKNQNEPEFMQAVTEVAENVIPYIVKNDIYYGQNILLRIAEPERVVSFRVAWIDDQEEIRVNRGYRIEMNSAIGPYKGGLRFHPNVNLSVLKFLAFEQIFKNSLTTLPMGGGKGGSDFNPTITSFLSKYPLPSISNTLKISFALSFDFANSFSTSFVSEGIAELKW